MNNSISKKLTTILLLLIFFIPVNLMVDELVRERSRYKTNTVEEISEKWGPTLHLATPIVEFQGKTYYPDNLEVSIDNNSSQKQRGIYKVPVFEDKINITADFSNLPNIENGRANLYLNDLKGYYGSTLSDNLTAEPNVRVNGSRADVSDVLTSSFSLASNNYQINIEYEVRGTKQILIENAGSKTEIKMSSNWPYPKFDGDSLPTSNITEEGFTANWELSSRYNKKNSDKVIIELFEPTDIYKSVERSVKYAMVIIAILFFTVFIIEHISKKNIHPFQYLLLGAALIVYYTLLLSTAEYVGYALAYIIASIAIVSMVTLYAKAIFKSKKLAAITGAVVALEYGIFYFLQISSENTLLLGSIMLFLILGLVMYLSTKMDLQKEN